MILCLLSLRYLIKILLVFNFNKEFKVKVLKLACIDSKACASRLHQVLKRSLAHWIKFAPRQEGEGDFQEKIFKKTCVMIVSVKICF